MSHNQFRSMPRLGGSPVRLPAAPAKFAPDPRRRSLIAKVKLAQKELGLADEDYRAILREVTGKPSAAQCDAAELVRVVERFKSRGFQAKPKSKPPAADHAVARKARALWISLHALGAIKNPSEQALEAFACQQLKVERLQWANQAHGYRLIEALKAMAERHGWEQYVPADLKQNGPLILRRRLVGAIMWKLVAAGVIPDGSTIDQAASSLLGMERVGFATDWSASELDVIARGLGERLRAKSGGAR